MDPDHSQIQERAYELWRRRGCPEGSAEQDWLRAESELKNRKTPGVYLTEFSAFPPSIIGVQTAVPVFVGYTQQAVANGGPVALQPVLIRPRLLAAYVDPVVPIMYTCVHNRNNWTFFGSDNGGKTAAVLRSFVTSCELVKVDPFTWFKDVLGRIADHPVKRFEELLPHRWVPTAN